MYEKKYNISKKRLEKCGFLRYTKKAVTLIALKREVAAYIWQVFRGANVKLGNWRQVTVSHIACVGFSRHTRESVQSPLVVLEFNSTKRRRLFLWQVK